MIRKLTMTAMCVCLTITAMANDTEIPGSGGVPDLTKGGKLKRINKRWAGPVGIYCGAWRPVNGRNHAHQSKYVRQLLVLEVEKGSPADGILKVGDVILGADGTGAAKVPLFEGGEWVMIPIADAITEAEARDPALLKLLVWRPAPKVAAPAVKAPSLDDMGSLAALDAGGGNALGDWGGTPKKQTTEAKKPEGSLLTVTIKLQSLGRYSDTAPYNCEKSKRILRQGIKALYESNDPGAASLGILCLLSADDPTNPGNDKYQARAKEWARKLIIPPGEAVSLSPWFSGPLLIVLSEYYMKTKDEAVFPTLIKVAEHQARGVSWFGTTGHKWADKQPDGSYGGRMSGYGPINCSGALGFLGLSLARKAGVNSPAIEDAIRRQRIFFGHFAFKGGIGYGEMPYAIGGGSEDPNARHGLVALALGLQEDSQERPARGPGSERNTTAGYPGSIAETGSPRKSNEVAEERTKFFERMSALSSYSTRQYAHGGPFFGQVFSPLSAAQGGVKAAHLTFKEIRWHLDLKRRWDGTRIYDPTNNKYKNFSYASTALLFYALPLKQLYITGRGQNESLQLNDVEFKDLLACKRFNAKKATNQELIAALSRFQGMRRSMIAAELTDRIKAALKGVESAALVDQLLALAAEPKANPTGRAGACHVLQVLKQKGGDAKSAEDLKIVKTMISLLKDPDPYMRFAAVRVMQTFHPNFSQVAVRPYANAIMDAIITTGRPTFPLDEEDPLQWAHGEMGAFLFGTVLAKNLDGVDRKKLVLAIRSVLQTPNASARNSSSRVLDKLTMEETLAVADVLVDNALVPPPANAMGGTALPNCLKVLGKHRFEETLPLSARYDNSNGSGLITAIKHKIPEQYGASVLHMNSAREFMRSLGELMLVGAVDVKPVLNNITKGAASETLNKLKSIHSIKVAQSELTLPATKIGLEVDATNYGVRDDNGTTYTWRKVSGPGKVTFAPNASGKSKTTTVSFTDQKPGKYRFEVTMSDTLEFNELTKTVDVTLYDKRGTLPANKPPRAKSQSITAVPGLPVPVTLSGTDPDGDDLGFVVTKQPSHGWLSGIGAKLSYTADFGHNGTDQLTFEAIDGQAERATGTVTFKVSDQNVGVVVYEGFDYPAGAIHERGGSPSFGFNGPWTNTRGIKDFYLVDRGSLEHAGQNPSISYPELPSTGGRLIKGKGWWPLSRPLDRKALSENKLLTDGGELWFSVFVAGHKGRAKFLFNLNDAGNPKGGTAIGFGFDGPDIFATKDGAKAGTSRVGWSRDKQVMFPENAPNMIIGHCVWAKTDTDPDTLEIYRVFDAPEFGPLFLEKPVCVVEDVISQSEINQVSLTDLAGGVDEIRMGPSLNSVMLGTKPLGEASSQ